jgi:hypothetical protein
MPIFDIFSKRQKKLRGEVPDVYIYDKLPESLRVQIVHIWWDTIGNNEQYYNIYSDGYKNIRASYRLLVEILCREYGTFRLPWSDQNSVDRDYYIRNLKFLPKRE